MASQRHATAKPKADGPAPEPSAVPGRPGLLDPTSLTIEQAAKLLGVDDETIGRHVDAGLPTAPGGTINLVTCAAWLNRELARNDAD